MKTIPARLFLAAATLVAASGLVSQAHAATYTLIGGVTDLTAGASWGGTAPTASDTAAWNSSSANASLVANSAVSWGAINITGALSNIDISGTGAITTGNITLAGAQSLTIANALTLNRDAIYSIADVNGTATADATLSGIIGGNFSLTKTGAGTLAFGGSAANTYSGGTIVLGGTLQVTGTSNGLLGGTSGVVALANTSGVTLDLNNHNSSIGALLGGGSNGGNVTLGSATLTISNGFGSYAGSISGTGGITKTSGGTIQVLSGTNSYSGVTTVTTGTLQFANRNAFYGANTANWTAAKLTVSSAGIASFNVGGSGEFTSSDIDTIQAISNIALNTAATTGFKTGSILGLDTTNATGGSFTYGTAITNHINGTANDTLGLAKYGSGTLSLTGNNTYTGSTTVYAGTLALSGSNGVTGYTGTTILGNTAFGGATLVLDHSTNDNRKIATGALTLTGGSIVLSGGSFAESVASTTFSTGVAGGVGSANKISRPSGSSTISLGAFARVVDTSSAGATLNLSADGIATTTATTVNGLLAATSGIGSGWATVGSGTSTRYATVSGGSIVGYTASTAAADGSGLTDNTGVVNYDLAAGGGTVGAAVSANTIRYTGGAGTTTFGSGLAVNGLMNAGTGLWTVGGTISVGTNATSGIFSEFIVNTASGDINLTGNIVVNGSSSGYLVKTGSGTLTLTLSGTPTYNKGTVINEGILKAGNANAFGSAAGQFYIAPGATVDLNGFAVPSGKGFTLSGSGVNGAGAVVNNGAATTAANVWALKGDTTIGGSGDITLNQSMTGNFALTKVGAGALVFGKLQNTLRGVTVNAGTLRLDFSNASAPTTMTNMIAGAEVLTLGGGTFELKGKSANVVSQSLAGVALTGTTASAITLTSNSATSLALIIGDITRSAGATLNITQPTGTVSTINGVATTTGTASSVLTAANGAAYATVGGTDWAAKDSTNSFIVGLSTIGGYTTFDTPGTVSLSGNADLTTAGTYTLGADSTTTTIRSLGAANTVDLGGRTLTTGGILSNNSLTISGAGSLQAAVAGGELVFNQTTGAATVSAVIANNTSASSFTKAGAGTLTLSGANTYTGGTMVTAGTLVVAASTGSIKVGAAGVTVASGAKLTVNGTLSLISNVATIANAGIIDGTGVIDIGTLFDGDGTTHTYTLISGSGSLSGASFMVTGFSNYSTVTFDNTTGNLVFTAVPEPSTYGLIGAGALAAVALVRRRRKQAVVVAA